MSGCAAALPEPFLELAAGADVRPLVDRVVDALGPSIGRIKAAQRLRGLPAGGARMTVAEPDPDTETTIKALVAEAVQENRR